MPRDAKFFISCRDKADHDHPADSFSRRQAGQGVSCVLPRQQAFGGPETVDRNQVPDMKFLLRLCPDTRGKWHRRGPRRSVTIRLPVWGAARAPVGGKRVPARGDPDGVAHGSAAVDIGLAAGEIPSPQTSKSASVFAGLRLMGRTSIRKEAVRMTAMWHRSEPAARMTMRPLAAASSRLAKS